VKHHILPLLRANVTAAIATALDFASYVALVTLLSVPPAAATALGCAVGGVVNFLLNRAWAFRSDGSLASQIPRYVAVSASSMFLNSVGVLFFVHHAGMDFRAAWWVVRGLVCFLWNYPLQRYFVFR
jgi:putative flippase GtrA